MQTHKKTYCHQIKYPFVAFICRNGISIAARVNHIIKLTVVCTLVATFLLSVGCKDDRKIIVKELSELDDGGYRDQQLSKRSVKSLRDELESIEDDVESIILTGERLGLLYKTVALRYMDREMYGLARDYFRKALDIYPNNHLISYKAGLCMAQLAQSYADPAERQQKFLQSAAHYLHAIRMDGSYIDALYALSILYIFELDQPAEALPHLERIVSIQSKQYRAMFLLARVHVGFGRIDDAAALYQEITENSRDREEVARAEENRRSIVGN
ncbi:MAG: hypothetical protein CMN78_04965 [Spirochaetales bacterium]|nr:hypothetical protein [Spirochaetales bacterium]